MKLTNVLLFEFTWISALLQQLKDDGLTSQMSLDEGGLYVSLYPVGARELYSLYL